MGEGQSSPEKLLEVDTLIVSLNVCLEWMASSGHGVSFDSINNTLLGV